MQNNVGKVDQTIRYVIAIILAVVAIITTLWWLLIPSVILAFTASVSFCGIYKVFGVNTCQYDSKDE